MGGGWQPGGRGSPAAFGPGSGPGYPALRAGAGVPMKIGGLRGGILFKLKEYPLALPKKNSRGDVVVASSISLASSLRIAYPSKTPPAPSSSFHRSSSSRCKHFVGLRREPFPFGHRLTHSAAPPLPTANAPLTLRREPYISPRDPLETTKGRGAAAPLLWNPTPGVGGRRDGWAKGRVGVGTSG